MAKLIMIMIVAMVGLTATTHATLVVANHSFEGELGDPEYGLADGTSVTIPPTGWTALGTAASLGVRNFTSSELNEVTIDGDNAFQLNTGGEGTRRIVLDLSDTYVAGQGYLLTVAVARRLDHTAVFDDTEWRITLGNGTTVLASSAGTILDDTRGGTSEGDFVDVSLSYTATASDAGNPIRIGLWNNDTVLDQSFLAGVLYDNVRLTIPEPAVSVSLLIGGATLALARRRNH